MNQVLDKMKQKVQKEQLQLKIIVISKQTSQNASRIPNDGFRDQRLRKGAFDLFFAYCSSQYYSMSYRHSALFFYLFLQVFQKKKFICSLKLKNSLDFFISGTREKHITEKWLSHIEKQPLSSFPLLRVNSKRKPQAQQLYSQWIFHFQPSEPTSLMSQQNQINVSLNLLYVLEQLSSVVFFIELKVQVNILHHYMFSEILLSQILSHSLCTSYLNINRKVEHTSEVQESKDVHSRQKYEEDFKLPLESFDTIYDLNKQKFQTRNYQEFLTSIYKLNFQRNQKIEEFALSLKSKKQRIDLSLQQLVKYYEEAEKIRQNQISSQSNKREKKELGDISSNEQITEHKNSQNKLSLHNKILKAILQRSDYIKGKNQSFSKMNETDLSNIVDISSHTEKIQASNKSSSSPILSFQKRLEMLKIEI